MSGVADTRRVLCVLSVPQTAEYRDELIAAGGPGVQFVFDPDAENALDRVASLAPTVVVVGMTLDAMDGLEFLAYLMKRHPDFSEQVIALPDRGDPFPAVLHRRDPATGRSTTEELEPAEVAGLIRSLVDESAARAQAPRALQTELSDTEIEAWESGMDDARQRSSHAGMPVTGDQAASSSHGGSAFATVGGSQGAAASGPRWGLIAGVGGGVLALLAVGFAVMGGEEEPKPAAASTGTPEPAAPQPEPAPDPSPEPEPESAADEAAGGAEPEPDAAPEPDAEPELDAEATDEPAPTADATELRELTSLPLRFRKGEAIFHVLDEAALQSLVAEANRALTASPGARLEVGGHTSREGDPRRNRRLGRRRAARVRGRLVELGVPADRIDVRSYGSKRPRADSDARGYRQDRRATVRIVD